MKLKKIRKRPYTHRVEGLIIFAISLAGLITFSTGHQKITIILLVTTVLFFNVFRLITARTALASLKWPYATATVKKVSQLTIHRKYSKSTFIICKYSYTVRGIEYENDLFTLMPYTGYRDISREPFYRHLKTMTIRYNPKKPKIAVEKPGINEKIFNPIIIGISLFLLIFAGVYYIVLLR